MRLPGQPLLQARSPRKRAKLLWDQRYLVRSRNTSAILTNLPDAGEIVQMEHRWVYSPESATIEEVIHEGEVITAQLTGMGNGTRESIVSLFYLMPIIDMNPQAQPIETGWRRTSLDHFNNSLTLFYYLHEFMIPIRLKERTE
jgi:hypothetical protein